MPANRSKKTSPRSGAAHALLLAVIFLALISPRAMAAATPGTPMLLSTLYSSVSGNKVTVVWAPVGGATGYIVKRATTSGGPYTTLASNVTGTSYIDSTTVSGTTYYYVVVATNGGVESFPSVENSPAPLAAWLKFDETVGESATDSAGHGWTGSLGGAPTWITGNTGNAVNLSGSSQYVSLPTGVANGLQDFTISTWVYLNSAATWARVFDFGTGTTNYMFLTVSSGTTPRFVIRAPGASDQIINSSVPLATGKWVHMAVTLKGSVGTLYVNGASVGSNTSMTLTPASLGATTKNYIGRSQYGNDPYLSGKVDDFRIFSGALSRADLLNLANLPPVIASPLLIGGIRNKPLSYKITGSGNPSSFGATGLPPGLTVDPGTGAIQGTATSAGVFSATITATSPSGTGSDTASFAIVSTGPRVSLNFDDGGSAPTDSSGNGWNTIAANGPTWVSGGNAKNLGSMRLTASSSQYLKFQTGVVQSLTDFTISCWIKPASISTPARLFDFGTDGNNSMYFTPKGPDGTARFGIIVNSVAQNLDGPVALTAGTWTHVAVTHSGSTSTLYVNGVAVATTTMTFTPSSLGITTNNYIGRSANVNDPYLDATLDDFQIYGVALGAMDIGTLAGLPTPALAAPASLSASLNGNVVLNWAPADGALDYNVKRAPAASGPYTTVVSGVTGTSFTDPAYDSNTLYYYVVSASNGGMESANSPVASITTPVVSMIYEAENALLSGPVAVVGQNAGNTGTGYADYVHNNTDYIQWSVNTAAAGNYSLAFRYANGGSSDRPLELRVNGVVVSASLGFPVTGGWANYATATATATFNAGTNVVRLTAIGSNGANLDHLKVTALSDSAFRENGGVVSMEAESGQVSSLWQTSSSATASNGTYIAINPAHGADGIVVVAVNTGTTGTTSVDQSFSIANIPGLGSLHVHRTSGTENMADLGSVSVVSGSFTYSLPAQSITTFHQ